MTKLTPPLTKTLFALAVAAPVLTQLEAITTMASATPYEWAGFAAKAIGSGVVAAVAMLSFRNNQQPPTS